MSIQVNKFTLDELCTLVDLPKRTIRYYIQQGLMDRPEGSKRGSYYLKTHVDQLLEIRKWQKAGLNLDRIKELLCGGEGEGTLPPPRRIKPGEVTVWSHLTIQEGIELHINPNLANLAPEQVRALVKNVMQSVRQIRNEE